MEKQHSIFFNSMLCIWLCSDCKSQSDRQR